MVSFTSFLFIKAMTGWNGLVDRFHQMRTRAMNLYQSICNWFHPDSGSWYLYPHTLFPISYTHYYRLGTSSWKYNPSTRELTYLSEEKDATTKLVPYRVSWLTARISSSDQTKDMDDFLGALRIYSTTTQETISPMVLLQAWSLDDKQWWSALDPRLEWFDMTANEHLAIWSNVPPIHIVPVRYSAISL
jgi:hypothetical protein